jgi:[acyl-carrier-protein] S-malonyltransferase
MEEAAKANPGKMIAILGLSRDIIKKICQESGTQIANINSPSQVVISGRACDIDKAVELANQHGAKRMVSLLVGGAFHSYLMESASLRLEEELRNIQILPAKFPVISNVTAKPFSSAQDIRHNLVLQLKSTVLWEDSVSFMIKAGAGMFFEIGPGSVLKGLLRNIDPVLSVYNLEKSGDLLIIKQKLKKQ